jgi:hypothetical protein
MSSLSQNTSHESAAHSQAVAQLHTLAKSSLLEALLAKCADGANQADGFLGDVAGRS